MDPWLRLHPSPTTRSSSLVGAIHNPASTLSARVYTQLTFVLQLRLPTDITSHTLSFHRAGDPLSGASELFLGRLSALGLAPKMTNQLVHFMQAVGRWSALTKHMRAAVTTALCHSSLVPQPSGYLVPRYFLCLSHTNFCSSPHKKLLDFFTPFKVPFPYPLYGQSTTYTSVWLTCISTMGHTHSL